MWRSRRLGRALLLNASFEPLCVVPDAPGGRARAEGEGGDRRAERRRAALRARARCPCPSVIRLHHFVRVPHRNRVPLSRRAVFARDGHRCQYCNRAAENIDHVVPRSRGGTHAWDNVVASCRSCNARKEDRLLSEAGLRLRAPAARAARQPLGRRHRRLASTPTGSPSSPPPTSSAPLRHCPPPCVPLEPRSRADALGSGRAAPGHRRRRAAGAQRSRAGGGRAEWSDVG